MTVAPAGMALDIRGLLARPMSELRGFTYPDGRPMTPRQVKHALLEQLAAGHEILKVCITVEISFLNQEQAHE